MVLHKTIAASPMSVALFFSIFNLMLVQTQSGFITLFFRFRGIFSTALNPNGVTKFNAADY
ncbi:hypothetical protein DN614_14210 [Klebsiella michiganensis]|nr:hypothetical protein [Klebsiella michiganensis]QHO86108.1 hypothetical protein CHQ91_09670 [Klebsiella michiganensis]RWS86227.1 hypothetical protein DN614_14210 [Klebsiella michiganensis]RXI16261.1 hypothetical protein DOD04_24950 [Klebsiella michiganensis]